MELLLCRAGDDEERGAGDGEDQNRNKIGDAEIVYRCRVVQHRAVKELQQIGVARGQKRQHTKDDIAGAVGH